MLAEGIRLQVGTTRETCPFVLASGSEGGCISAGEGFLLNQCGCLCTKVPVGNAGKQWCNQLRVLAMGPHIPDDLVAPPTGVIHFEL